MADVDASTRGEWSASASAARREIAFVDPVAGHEELVRGLSVGPAGRQLEVIVLEAGRDGIQQISEALQGRLGLDAIHILSHGTDGAIRLGSRWLGPAELRAQAGTIGGWKSALARRGDILVYGCGVAAGPRGRDFIRQLAHATDSDITASDDATGSATLGGDWDLEFATGPIETPLAIEANAPQPWHGILATLTVDTTNDVHDGNTTSIANLWASKGADGLISLREAVIAANNTAGADVINKAAGTYTLSIAGAGENAAATGDLDITDSLNASSTPAAAQALMRDVTYVNVSDALSTAARTVRFVLTDGRGGTSAAAMKTINVTAVNDAPTLTAMAAPVATVNEDSQATVTFANLQTQGNEADVDGTVTAFVVKAVSSGTLLIGTNAGTATAWAAGTNDTIDATRQGYWTAALNANGTLNAFTVVARDNDALESATPVQVQVAVTAVNDAPTLTTMAAPVVTVNEDTQATVTFANVQTQGNEADVDGTVTAFVVKAVSSGTLRIGTSAGTATAWAAGSNDTIDGTRQGYWTGALNANGTLSAFTVVARDNGALESATPVQVQVTVNAVNDAPTLDAAKSPALTAQNEDSGAPVGAVGTLVSALVNTGGALNNVTDPDAGALLGIAITAADTSQGSWFYSTDNGTNWSALGAVSGSNARLLAADANTRLYFQPVANYNGSIAAAITFHVWDRTSGTAGATVGLTVNNTVLDQFAAVAYGNNDGTTNWSAAWVETDSNGGGASGGRISVDGGQLDIRADAVGDSLYREMNLGGATSATLSFTYNNTLGSGDAIVVEASSNGGGSYTVLAGGTFSSSANIGSGTFSVDITPQASANTRIRFYVTTESSNKDLFIDNVQIAYTTLDGSGTSAFSTASDTASLVVNPVNDASTASNLSAAETYIEDTPSNLTDIVVSDVDSASVTATLTLSNAAAGSLNTATSGAVTSTYNAGTGVWTASGATANVNALLAALTFTPTANFNGNFTIATSISDGSLSVTGSKAITGTAVNDAPTATNLNAAQTYTEDTPLALTAIVASDVDSASVTATLTLSNAGAGSLNTATSGAVTSTYNAGTGVWTASGATADVNALLAALTFTPTANFNGNFTFATSVSDGSLSVTGSKAITGTAVNDAPTATNLSAAQSYTEDTPLALTVIVASDADSASVTATLTLSNVAAGSLNVGTSGAVTSTYNAGTGVWSASGATADVNALLAALTFTPTANFNGNFTIGTSVSDGSLSVTGSKAITGTAVNDAPTATAQAVTTAEDTAATITLTGTDVDGDALTFTVGTPPAQGTLTGTAPNLTYTPAADYAGADTFTFRVNDGTVDSSPATVSITVTAVNGAPTATAQAVTTAEDTAATITLIGTDVENDALTFTVVTPPAQGMLTGTAPNLTYTPAANYAGPDTFTFTVSDRTATSAAATVSLTVTAVNDAPVATAQSVSVAEDGSVAITLAGTDLEGDALTFTVGTPPAQGTLTGTAPNLTYTPTADYAGPDAFTFTVTDGALTSAEATVSITVTPVVDALAITGRVTASDGSPLAGVVLELGGAVVATTASDAAGRYAFVDLPSGRNYTVSASKGPGYVFAPRQHAVVAPTDTVVADFNALLLLTVSGQVRDRNGSGVANVEIALACASTAVTTTDSGGRYAFDGVPEGTRCDVTASAAGFDLDPPARTLPALAQDETVDFEVVSGVFTRYFAEGATGSFFDTRIALLNATGEPAKVRVRFQRTDGVERRVDLTLGGMARATVDPEEDPELASTATSTVIESTQPLIAERSMRWDASGYGSHAETSIARPLTRWYLAEGATISGFDLFYLIQNPADRQADIEVTYLLPVPQLPIVKTYTVGAGSRFSIWVNQEDPRLAAAEVSAVVTSRNAVPVIVERAMYLSRGGQYLKAGHAGAAVEAPATQWYLAEGATGDFFDLFTLVANPNAETAQLEVRYLLPEGAPLVKTYEVAGRSRFNIWVDQEDSRLAATAVAQVLRSTNGVPVVVERAMWWPGPSWAEGHNSAGVVQTGAKWAIADGEDGGRFEVETYVLVANRSPAAGQVKVTVVYEDGTSESQWRPLTANSRQTLAMRDDFPGTRQRRYGMVVEADDPALQLVVERSTYSNSGGTHWAAGANAVGTRLR